MSQKAVPYYRHLPARTICGSGQVQSTRPGRCHGTNIGKLWFSVSGSILIRLGAEQDQTQPMGMDVDYFQDSL